MNPNHLNFHRKGGKSLQLVTLPLLQVRRSFIAPAITKETAEMPPSLGRVWNSCKTETFPPAAKKTGTGPICTLTRKPELCGVGQVFAETASTADAIRKIFRSLVGAAQNSRSENSPNNNLPCSIIFGSL